MNNKVYLIHGFNVKDDGASTVGSIRGLLEADGFDVTEITYGWFHRMRVRLCNKGIASVIADLVEPDSTCIAHSNGGALAYLACEMGAPFKNVVLVNPALNRHLKMAEHVEKVQVWYAPHDKWTGLARWIPNSIWGAMGRLGFQGEDPRVTQFDEEKEFGRFEDEHSGMWKSTHARQHFVDEVKKMIKGS